LVPNSFGIFNGEKLLYDWRMEQGCSGCGGTHYTTLTDNRLLTRYEECVCSSCCSEPAHNDSSIFLYDIAQLVESTQARNCLDILCIKCCSCCCRGPKYLQVRGSFTSEIIYLSKEDMPIAKPAIAEAIARHKPANQR
jgi:hypothetical protein